MDKGKVIVIQFVTLDGVVEDPDGAGNTPGGGWAFRSGPKRVAAGDFKIGSILVRACSWVGRRYLHLSVMEHCWRPSSGWTTVPTRLRVA